MRIIKLNTAQQVTIQKALFCASKMYDEDIRRYITPAMQDTAAREQEAVHALLNTVFNKIS